MAKIGERVNTDFKGKKFNKLCIFPEGTTSNGKYLLEFKKGAFVNLTPLKIRVFKYSSNFDTSYNMMRGKDSFLGITFSPINKLTVEELDCVVEPVPGTTY